MQTREKNRCILFARGRCGEAHDSMEHQVERLRDFASRKNLRVVDTVRVDTDSATRTAREEVAALLVRKVQHDDFDIVLTADLSRLGREGVAHTIWTLARFRDVNLRLATLDNGFIDPNLCALFRVSSGGSEESSPHAKNYKDRREAHSSRDDVRGARTVPYGADHMDQGTGGTGVRPNKGERCRHEV